MKKLVLVLLAVFLVIPALSNAGSVSSRYDVTFGGFVKYDLGWSSQNTHADPAFAQRHSQMVDNRADEYGNTFATGGETRFNFLIKGPDLWGAKTSAFIEGDFRGSTTNNANGGFQLRHAFMTLNWQSAELMIGQNWQQWGMPYYPAEIGNNDFAQYLKGIRTPQMALRFFITKEFNAMFGLTSATDWSGNGTYPGVRQYNDDYARSSWPGLMGEIAFWSDRCGKIGPNNLKFGLGGYYGRESKTYTELGGTQWRDDTINAWLTAFRYSIPIIPEKQGNKAMALLLNGNFFYGQNVGGNNWMSPGPSATWNPSQGSYFRYAGEAAAPTVFGLFAQGTFWLTNTLQFNAMYGYLKYNYSAGARDQMPDGINMMQTYAANLLWDANQAIRFGIQWMTMFTGYNRSGAYPGTASPLTPASAFPGLSRTGQIDQYRFAAWYFF